MTICIYLTVQWTDIYQVYQGLEYYNNTSQWLTNVDLLQAGNYNTRLFGTLGKQNDFDT